jgi:cytochrome c biogenesis protein CcmG/thiol:disulfide interchange protein DsbE
LPGAASVSKRGWILLGSVVPVFALIAVLSWASVKSGSKPGGLGVNSEFGQVSLDPQSAHQFSVELLDGGTLALSDLRGKVVLLDFWASWCPPCRQEAAVLAEVYREYGGADVEFLGINIWDRRQDALDFVEQFDVPYPNAVDSEGAIAINYGVRGIPEKFVIDQAGVVVKKFVGPMRADTLRAILDEAIKGAEK